MSTAREDMACRHFHGTSSRPPTFFFFHVSHDNVMTVDFHLKSVQCVFFEYLDAMASIHAGRLQVD